QLLIETPVEARNCQIGTVLHLTGECVEGIRPPAATSGFPDELLGFAEGEKLRDEKKNKKARRQFSMNEPGESQRNDDLRKWIDQNHVMDSHRTRQPDDADGYEHRGQQQKRGNAGMKTENEPTCGNDEGETERHENRGAGQIHLVKGPANIHQTV